ncbi:MAG TPA: hypothetical protein VFJ13_09640 [Paracoccaceae bacterium]|nr:hypothetical protein [Paracoccaceae bacterium]
MPNERILFGKLQIAGRSSGWVYEQAPLLCKKNDPQPTKEYEDFSRQVVMAGLKMQQDAAASKVIAAFKNIKFMVDILPATGGGYFMPNCKHDTSLMYEIPRGADVGAIIVWDPVTPFTHTNTADSSSTTYPPWVILAHEIGHAIQLDEASGSASAWLATYMAGQEAVEMDNIGRHETPIVASLALKPRVRYL